MTDTFNKIEFTRPTPGNVYTATYGDVRVDVRVECDTDTRPDHYECYTPEQVATWERDEWEFVGLVASISYKGLKLSNAASLWGIDNTYDQQSTDYLNTVAAELVLEAIAALRSSMEGMEAALQSIHAAIPA